MDGDGQLGEEREGSKQERRKTSASRAGRTKSTLFLHLFSCCIKCQEIRKVEEFGKVLRPFGNSLEWRKITQLRNPQAPPPFEPTDMPGARLLISFVLWRLQHKTLCWIFGTLTDFRTKQSQVFCNCQNCRNILFLTKHFQEQRLEPQHICF